MERGDAPRGLGTGKESSYGASFWCLRAARRRFSSEMRNLRVAVLLVLLDAPHADAQNLLPNPAFASGVGGWTASGPSLATFQWLNLPGPDGRPGIARLQISGPGSGFASACVPVVAGRTYSWGASFLPETGSGQVILDFFSNASCQGTTVVGEVWGPPALPPGRWTFLPSPNVLAPPSAMSVLFRITCSTGAAGFAVTDVDNVYFGFQGTQPPGIQDVPALTAPVALAFLFALALSGLRLLQRGC